MKINTFVHAQDQECILGSHVWSVARLFQLSKELKVMNIPLDYLNIYSVYKALTLREMVSHFKAVQKADLFYPIILDEDGELMDGRHRIMKAIMKGKKTIRAVRFETNPKPCRTTED